MMADDADAWRDFFVMGGGAAATLAGLIFVAVSLNHEEILRVRSLPALAARTLSILIALVLLSFVGLAPHQPRVALGSEVLIIGAGLVVIVISTTVRTLRETPTRRWRARLLCLASLATAPTVVAGLSLVAGIEGGLYWILVEFVTGVIVSVYYAWTLLVEIRR